MMYTAPGGGCCGGRAKCEGAEKPSTGGGGREMRVFRFVPKLTSCRVLGVVTGCAHRKIDGRIVRVVIRFEVNDGRISDDTDGSAELEGGGREYIRGEVRVGVAYLAARRCVDG